MKILDQLGELLSLRIKEAARGLTERRLGDGFDLERLERVLLRIYVQGKMSGGDFNELRMMGFLRAGYVDDIFPCPFEVGQKVKYKNNNGVYDIKTKIVGVKWSEEFRCWYVSSEVNNNWIHESFYK